MKSVAPRNTSRRHLPQLGEIGDIAKAMRRADPAENGLRPVTFLIGAGCSVSAGVPIGATIAKYMTVKLTNQYGYKLRQTEFEQIALEALKKLTDLKDAPEALYNKGKPDWGIVYDYLFREIYSSPDDARIFFKEIIRDNSPRINWAHLALGELASQNWISTTITTNFDLLALEGYARAGVIPVVSDGLESLDRIDATPEYQQLIQINGSIHTYRLRNKEDELEEVSSSTAATTCFRNLYQASRAFVVIGYAGRERAIMQLLIDAQTAFPDKHVYWCMYGNNPEDLSENAREFLGPNPNSRLLTGQNADVFFMELCKELEVGSPASISDPIGFLKKQREALFKPDESESLSDIVDELNEFEGKISELEDCYSNKQAEIADSDRSILSKARKARLRGDKNEVLSVLTESNEKTAPTFAILFEKGNVLLNLGMEESGEDRLAHLRGAINTYEKALEIQTRATMPTDWAMTQVNRAIALQTLGENASGPEGVDLLQQAVKAYDAALEVYTRRTMPVDWARTQMNLANTLQALGDRASGVEGIDLLQQAVKAYDAALEVNTRESMPVDWARTQMNRAAAFVSLGERASDKEGIDLLQQAMNAYDAALEVRVRETMPADWAMTQVNRAIALSNLGESAGGQEGLDYLQQAVDACDAALEVITRETMPAQWAKTQVNRAITLRNLGERASGQEGLDYLQQAIDAYDAALEVFGEPGMEFYADGARNNREIAVASLERLKTELED